MAHAMFESEWNRAYNAEQKAKTRQELEDMAEVASTAGGVRILARQCQLAGIGRLLPENSQGAIAEYNQGLNLLNLIGKANPKAALQILAACFNLPAGLEAAALQDRPLWEQSGTKPLPPECVDPL